MRRKDRREHAPGNWGLYLGQTSQGSSGTAGELSADGVARLNELFHLLTKMTILMSGFIWVINVTVGRDGSVPAASLRQRACEVAEWKDHGENWL